MVDFLAQPLREHRYNLVVLDHTRRQKEPERSIEQKDSEKNRQEKKNVSIEYQGQKYKLEADHGDETNRRNKNVPSPVIEELRQTATTIIGRRIQNRVGKASIHRMVPHPTTPTNGIPAY
jgi:hypothetical protein